MHLLIIAVSLIDVFLFSPIQPRAVERIMAPPAVINAAWRPTGQVLARGAFGEITDHDLFFFMHMRGADPAELARCGIYFSNDPAFAATRELDAEWIRGHLSDLITLHYLANQAGDQAPVTPDLKALLDRTLEYPAAEMIWIDNEVVPKIKIDKADVIGYYRQFEAEFQQMGQYEVQYAFVRAPLGQTEVQRRDIITYLERLKSSLAESTDWKATIEEMFKRQPEVLVEYRQESLQIGHEPTSTFSKNVYELQPGQFSPVFETLEGYYLIYSLKADPPKTIPLAQAEAQIRQKLHERLIVNQFNIEINKLLLKTNYQLYADRWDFLPENGPLLVIRDFRVNRLEVEQLMSNQIYLTPEIMTPAISLLGTGLLNREVMMHRLRKEKFWGDPRRQKGQDMAGKFLNAMNVIATEYNQQVDEETPARMRQYFESNPELFQSGRTLRLIQVIGTLQNPDRYLPSDRVDRVESMKRRLEEFVRQADTILADSRQQFRDTMAAGGPAASTSTLALELFAPAKFEAILAEYNTNEYQFTAVDVGNLDITGLLPLEEALEGVAVGHFSPVGIFENTAATYYVWDALSPGQQTLEERIPFVRQTYRTQNMLSIWQKHQAEALSWAGVTWSY